MKKYLTVSAAMLLFILVQCKKDEMALPERDVDLMVIAKINELRQSGCNCGTSYMPPVPNLSINKQLQDAARAHAKDMAERNYFDHLSPEGGTPEERALNAGYTGDFKAENLGKGYSQADQVIAAWKSSVSHCKAMMDAKSKEAGAGTTHNYWVVAFGSSL
ncbi:MAG: CAP domain-containing protein [Sphingobacteriaceae bacterium]|nr:CAP domain-containing protein [Sphingobacteriaceae bacterium]